MRELIAVMVIIAGVVFLGFLLSYPLMLLWNLCLVPAVSTLHTVDWLQMWGISILIGLLFKTNATVNK